MPCAQACHMAKLPMPIQPTGKPQKKACGLGGKAAMKSRHGTPNSHLMPLSQRPMPRSSDRKNHMQPMQTSSNASHSVRRSGRLRSQRGA